MLTMRRWSPLDYTPVVRHLEQVIRLGAFFHSARDNSVPSLDDDETLEEIVVLALREPDIISGIQAAKDIDGANLRALAFHERRLVTSAAAAERERYENLAHTIQRRERLVQSAVSSAGATSIAFGLGPSSGLLSSLVLRILDYIWKPSETLDEIRGFYVQTAAIHGAVPLFRERLHVPTFAVSFVRRDTPGLASPYDPLYEVSTPAADRVERLIASLPSAAIAVGGARGVGKTSLLRSFASGRRPRALERPLSLLIAAPVTYVSREFLVLLAQEFCMQILGGRDAAEALSGFVSAQRSLRNQIAAISGLILVTAGAAVVAVTLRHIAVNASIVWGICLILAGLIAISTLVRIPLESFSFAFGPTTIRWRRSPAPETRDDKLAEHALQLYRAVRFQQAAAKAVNAAIKSPVGLDLGGSSTSTLTTQQLTYPEVVSRLRDLLELAGEQHRVVLAIDEIDKIAEPDRAYAFVNDLKALFGVPNCQFLVSISDDALAAFDRRSTAVRDALDSAFDEVVSVEHHTLLESRQMLRRRVLSLPIPFVFLCHCLSGGLGRDTLRSARSLLADVSVGDSIHLSSATQRLARSDLLAIVRGLVMGVRGFEPEDGDFDEFCEDALAAAREESVAEGLHTLLSSDTRLSAVLNSVHADQAKTEAFLKILFSCYYFYTLVQVFSNRLEWEGFDRTAEALTISRNVSRQNPILAWQRLSACRQSIALAQYTLPLSKMDESGYI